MPDKTLSDIDDGGEKMNKVVGGRRTSEESSDLGRKRSCEDIRRPFYVISNMPFINLLMLLLKMLANCFRKQSQSSEMQEVACKRAYFASAIVISGKYNVRNVQHAGTFDARP